MMKLTDTHKTLATTHKKLVEAGDNLYKILRSREGPQEYLATINEVSLSIEKLKIIMEAISLKVSKDSSKGEF